MQWISSELAACSSQIAATLVATSSTSPILLTTFFINSFVSCILLKIVWKVSTAAWIRPALSAISPALLPAWDTAFSTSLLISLINSVILATESALFFASVPISEATTAKPLPASPALAASIEAFKDKRFVSSAILPIRLIMSTISPDAVPTLSTASCKLWIESSMPSSALLTFSIS